MIAPPPAPATRPTPGARTASPAPAQARCLVVLSWRSIWSLPSASLVTTATAVWSNSPSARALHTLSKSSLASARSGYLAAAKTIGVLASMRYHPSQPGRQRHGRVMVLEQRPQPDG